MGRRWLCAVSLALVSGCYVGAEGSNASGAATEGEPGQSSGESSADASGSSGEPVGETEDEEEPARFVGRAPLRRLTRFEFNNTVRDLLDDDTSPADALPSEQSGNGFGNDADAQSVSSLLAEQYSNVADEIAVRATESPEKLAALMPCAADSMDDAAEDACAFSFIESFAAKAFRRPLVAGEADELFELQQTIREDATFPTSLAAVIEAVLQSPDFLYRLEFGEVAEDGHLRPTPYEMASRLSYFLWGSMPDQALLDAAESGALRQKAGVREQAERMLEDPQARVVTRFFFESLLPITGLSALERDPERYPEYTAEIGRFMNEETQLFLEREIFEGSGSWRNVLTADYTYLNGPLADFYGVGGVAGEAFTRVDLDPAQRMGILTHAGVMAGTVHSNETNPVRRGAFVVREMLCLEIPLPTGDVADEVAPPDPGSGPTARDRYSAHSDDPRCAGCHVLMDPIGLTFENYDAVGRWRDTENDVDIDASGQLPTTGEDVQDALELIGALANEPQAHACIARHFANFAYGRTLDEDEDELLTDELEARFMASDTNVRELLIDITQTETFNSLPEDGGGE